jgi:hypothetical protein
MLLLPLPRKLGFKYIHGSRFVKFLSWCRALMLAVGAACAGYAVNR